MTPNQHIHMFMLGVNSYAHTSLATIGQLDNSEWRKNIELAK